ncbi:PREDICTED: uncharacterized protein LOC105560090 isoform X2 [Vollenhovia emeryi]|uniref:uncharacterized protein LOC105560090 isoform X2 n=1 Tax=Vollenhovia emeryi TaxID=411798 RepID=UPI0005F52DA9|nr:PREDICTED: uncharacterized protein LOC105560090 isoform X2 [Vollenhovia emeryi]
MGVLKSFSFNRPELEKYFFYTFNVHLLLRGACTTIWAAVAYVFEIKTFEREMVAVSLEMLIGAGCALLAFAFCAGGYSILYFGNATFRNRPTYNRFCITAMFASLFLIILIVQSAAAIHMLVVISEDFVTKFKDAFINYGFRWEDTNYIAVVFVATMITGILVNQSQPVAAMIFGKMECAV